jgi:hypothetical protein
VLAEQFFAGVCCGIRACEELERGRDSGLDGRRVPVPAVQYHVIVQDDRFVRVIAVIAHVGGQRLGVDARTELNEF